MEIMTPTHSYAQELLGFRKDVKIINITLSNINEYLLHFIYNEPKVYVQNNNQLFARYNYDTSKTYFDIREVKIITRSQ